MARPYCARCQTEVILDSDGESCPNCHARLVNPTPAQTKAAPPPPEPPEPTPPPPKRSKRPRRKRPPRSA